MNPKNRTALKSTAFAVFIILAGVFLCKVAAQQKSNLLQRCATMDRLRLYESDNNALKSATETKARRVMSGPDAGNFRLLGIATIPVIVHIVLPNPYLVTDADVQAQIDRLNGDFSGLNADSTNAVGFYQFRGHSQIQFSLARRTPAGELTNGIERRSSGVGSEPTSTIDPIKRTALGGLNCWNPSQYLNLWIGTDATGQGILGYADNIGPGSSLDDGVFLSYQSFGTSSCYTIPQYNRGRTGTHEVGHYLGLYHIWGDDNGGCSGDDFEQLPATTTFSLPNGLFNPKGLGNGTSDVGDTPNQGDATVNCPGGVATDACAAADPGKMYQNHMDYSQDACLSMFTKQQVARMEWVLENARPGLLTSLGCQPPAGAVLLDAAPLSSVSPGGFELSGCRSIYYADTLSCPGNITPKFRVVNKGMNPITSLTVGYSYDDGPAATKTINVNIGLGETYVVSFEALPVTIGTHTLRFFTANPNGSADQITSNDSYSQAFTVMAPVAPPIDEGLESTLPLTTWTTDNPDFDFTWQRTSPGRAGTIGKLSINNYEANGYHNKDDFRSTAITVDPASAYFLSFDLAHKQYPDPEYADSLAVLISTDCGQTFTRVFYKGGSALATAGTSDEEYSMPAETDWRTETVPLNGALLASGKIVVLFRNISGWGNWVHLDNINLVKLGARDLQLTAVSNPGTSVCSGTFKPAVVVENVGLEAVTSFSAGYRIDDGPVQQLTFLQTIQPGASVTVTLPQATTGAGEHTITTFSSFPTTTSGTGETRFSNDTVRKTFAVIRQAGSPLVENFDNNFPSPGWSVDNPNNNVTWVRNMPGKASQYSLFFDNFNNNVEGQTDDLRTPFMDVTGADSVLVRFDVAHKNLTGSPGDNLSVLVTGDCGSSFTPVYSRSGAALATAGTTTTEYTNPAASDWRTEEITLDAQALTGGSLGLVFRNTNDFGNNIYLDNLNITAVYKRDIRLVSVQQPKNLVCAASLTPSIRVQNLGTDPVQSLTIAYTVNNGAVVTKTVSGLWLERGDETNINLAAMTELVPGSYSFRVYGSELTTASGSGDSNRRNDTLSIAFSVPGMINAPFVESFAKPGFPSNGWSVLNSDASYTWQRYLDGNGNEGAAFFNTFNYFSNRQVDQLVSPVINVGMVDSVRLSFDLAAATFGRSGGPLAPMDTLEVQLTTDCGNSFATVYKKWGTDLQTMRNTYPAGTEFFPRNSDDWRSESIDISAYADKGPFVVFFRATNNNENNIFLDNISVNTKILPTVLKQQGYLVYPSPFRSNFTVWHYQTPTDLASIRMMNTTGQTLWSKRFNGNADKQEAVDFTGKPAGVYFVEIRYTSNKKPVVQKLVKDQ